MGPDDQGNGKAIAYKLIGGAVFASFVLIPTFIDQYVYNHTADGLYFWYMQFAPENGLIVTLVFCVLFAVLAYAMVQWVRRRYRLVRRQVWRFWNSSN